MGPVFWAKGCSRVSISLCPRSHRASKRQLQAALPFPKDIFRVLKHPGGTKTLSHRGAAAPHLQTRRLFSPSPRPVAPASCAALRGERGQPPAAAEADHVAPNEIQTLAER